MYILEGIFVGVNKISTLSFGAVCELWQCLRLKYNTAAVHFSYLAVWLCKKSFTGFSVHVTVVRISKISMHIQ